MAPAKAIFDRGIFHFFRDLGKHNKLTWMDANRERYQSQVAQPFRRLLEEMASGVLQLNPHFETSGRRGANFSRINNDIRFSRDKTLYKTQMYLKFSVPLPGGLNSGQLYAGISSDTVTAGFRIYGGPKRKESTIALVAGPRMEQNPKWLARQKKRLGKRYESYWYSMVKGEWKKIEGWPTPEDWPKLQGWIVRRKLPLGLATSAAFPRELTIIFRELYPLVKFSSLAD